MILTHGQWYFYDSIVKSPYLISFEHSLHVELQRNVIYRNLTETCWEIAYISHYDKEQNKCSYCEENHIELKKNLCKECFSEMKTYQHKDIFSINVFHKSDPIRVHVYNPDDFNITIDNCDYFGYIEHIAWYDGNHGDYDKIYHARFAYSIWLIRDLGDVRLIIVSALIQLSKGVREKINEIQRINDI
jgi:hypothetical protein